MSSNEHPDMSGNPCDDPIVCDQCGDACNESDLYGSAHDESKNFCRLQCVYDFEEGRENVPMESGVDSIAAERQRQISVEGWSAEHDDTHRDGELAIEAALWATEQTAMKSFRDGMCGPESHRQSKSRVRQLVIAGALIAAEIDRLQRLDGQSASTPIEPSASSVQHMLHRLWSSCVGKPGYDKQAWREIERQLNVAGVIR